MQSAFLYCDASHNLPLPTTVPPLSMDVTGAEEAVLEGETVTLLCEVRGARPPATITWMNGTVPVEEAPTVVNVQVRVDWL